MKFGTSLPFSLIFTVITVCVMSADISGVWKAQLTGPSGEKRDILLVLKADRSALTGTVVGIPVPDMKLPIANGKITGNEISFDIVMDGDPEVPGQSRTVTFGARIDGNRLTGSVAGPGGRRFTFSAVADASAGLADTVARARAPERAGERPPNPQGANPTPVEGQKAILAAFDKYEIVGGLNPHQGNKDVDDFILALVRNPSFADQVDDLAVECGNSLYQPVLDGYIAGEDVALADVQVVWRNTTQPTCGFSALYEELFPLVRRINERRRQGRKLRVLALDPPIDWSKVKSVEDVKPFMDRDASIASVLENEVLAKQRRAFVIIGIHHIRHDSGAARVFEQKYPGRMLVVSVHWDFGGYTPLAKYNDELEKRTASWPVPSLVTIKGTWLADLESAYFSPTPNRGMGRGFHGVDGYLYLGPRDLLLAQPIPAKIALDKSYMAELQRRAEVTGAPRTPQGTLQEEMASTVFFHDPEANRRHLVEPIRKEPRDN